MDWWFCSDEHALQWLEWRHRNRATYKILRTGPCDRQSLLNGKTIEQYCESTVVTHCTSSKVVASSNDDTADV